MDLYIFNTNFQEVFKKRQLPLEAIMRTRGMEVREIIKVLNIIFLQAQALRQVLGCTSTIRLLESFLYHLPLTAIQYNWRTINQDQVQVMCHSYNQKHNQNRQQLLNHFKVELYLPKHTDHRPEIIRIRHLLMTKPY